MKKEFKSFELVPRVMFVKVKLDEVESPPPYADLYEAWVFAEGHVTYICSAQQMAECWFADLHTTSAIPEDDSITEWMEDWEEFQFQYMRDMYMVDYFDYSKTLADSIPVDLKPVLIESDKDYTDEMGEATSHVREDADRYLDLWLKKMAEKAAPPTSQELA